MKVQHIESVWLASKNGGTVKYRDEGKSYTFGWNTERPQWINVYDGKTRRLIEMINSKYVEIIGVIEGEIVPTPTPPS